MDTRQLDQQSIDQLKYVAGGVRVGKVLAFTEEGKVIVDFAGNTIKQLEARMLRSIETDVLRHACESQADILLVFENDDLRKPIIIDLLFSYLDSITSAEHELGVSDPQDITIAGKRVTFDAKDQVKLQCGKASITLTKSGKILIKGAYLLSRSSGTNKIKGGSVQIN